MNDIEPLNGADNIGGIVAIQFALADDIESIPDPVGLSLNSAIVMKAGKRFYNAQLTIESTSFVETAEETDSGAKYNKRVGGFCSCDTELNAALFDEMENALFVVKAQDSNNNVRIVGTKEQPIKFSIDRNVPADHATAPGLKISFYGEGTHQSYFYNVQ